MFEDLLHPAMPVRSLPGLDSVSVWTVGIVITAAALFFAFLFFDSVRWARLTSRHLKKRPVGSLAMRGYSQSPLLQLAVMVGLPIVTVLVAAGIRFALNPVLGHSLPFTLFFPAILISARYGGISSGVAACALSLVVACFLWILPDVANGAVSQPARILVFLFVALGMVFFDGWRRPRARSGEEWAG